MFAVVIEDDDAVRGVLVDVFEQAGCDVAAVADGAAGIEAAEARAPAIVAVDIHLARGIDGFETVRRLRAISDTHIVIVSAACDETDIVMGLTAGADDYVVKPFRVRELRARVDAALRRERSGHHDAPASAAPRILQHRDLTLDAQAHIVTVAGHTVTLTPTEFDLLRCLLTAESGLRGKDELALIVSGHPADSGDTTAEFDTRSLESHMANLRRKLGDSARAPRYIRTVHGIGYRLTLDDE